MSLLKEENEMAIVNPILCRVLSIQAEVEQKHGGTIPFLCCYHNKSQLKSECAYIRFDKTE